MAPNDASRAVRAPERLIFVVATLASAFLVFLVQPMVGKRILPWFGGAPAVWSLCLAFYQSALFCGYAYAHGLVRFASPGLQVGVHAALLAAACLALPVLPGDAWRPTGVDRPTLDVLLLLLAHVALPFVALAATGPLVQAWWAQRHPLRSPYPLYAVSNAGSLLALLAYPFVLEPRLPLSVTGTGWSIAFVATGVAVVACAALAWRARSGIDGAGARVPPHAPTPPARLLAWIALPGLAVVVLMGVTNEMTLDAASVPFLWILPLGTYLLTFILSFASERFQRRGAFAVLTGVAFLATAGAPLWRDLAGLSPGADFFSFAIQIPAYCLLLFGVGMLLHGELHRLRPAPERLTTYYLCVSGGGALGGVAVGLGAPAVFDDYYELPVGLALAAAAFLASRAVDPQSRLHYAAPSRWRWAVIAPLAVGLLAGAALTDRTEGLIHRERSFFGVLRVTDAKGDGPVWRRLTSGTTVHGVQIQQAGRTRLPTSYYGRATAVGLWMTRRLTERPLRVGVVGLGVGTLATYGLPGDSFRFYEIDPAVVRIARDDGLFSYLRESPAEVEIVLGDARLSIEREQREGIGQRFDLLVLDAFASDAIPVHLLTREAFEIYASALAPDGLLAVHVSNRHFDLMGLVARQGFAVGRPSLVVETANAPGFQSRRAHWVFLGRDAEAVRRLQSFLAQRAAAMRLPASHLVMVRPTPGQVEALPVWTDDYSDLLSTLRPL
jgi:spermidine synthase